MFGDSWWLGIGKKNEKAAGNEEHPFWDAYFKTYPCFQTQVADMNPK